MGVGNGSARIDEKTGELVVNMTAGTVNVSRRVTIDADDGGVRVTDTFRNTTAAAQQLAVQLSSSINFGVQQSQAIPDPKNAAVNLGWMAQLAVGPGKVAVDVYAGPGGRVVPTIESQPGNNVGTATVQLAVPANGVVSLVHYHLVVPSTDAGTAWVAAMRPNKMLADLPKEIRRSVVNFRVGGGLLGDQEVLRGDLLDVVELRNGDRLNGTLNGPGDYKLDTFYGTVDVPAERVVGIVSAGAYRPRQLLVTTDGQIFGGHLERPTIGLQLTSGQTVQVPLDQVARVGYRRRPGEPTDAADDGGGVGQLRPPYVLLATGDRMAVTMPPTAVPVMTRYGPLSIPPGVLAGIVFANDETGLHTVTLTDGTHFGGLVTLADFTATLPAAGGPTTGPTTAPSGSPTAVKLPTTVRLPVATLSRIVFAADDADRPTGGSGTDAPALHVRKDDLLVGTLVGQLKVDTAFDTVTVDAAGIRSLAPGKGTDLAITTWDGTVFNGQVQDPTVSCHLSCGVDVRVPVSLIDGYTNPSPAVPELMRAKVAQLVHDLDADDWQARDAAEKQLVQLGPGVAGTLRAVRDRQPPEAQQRIDAVLRELK